jgi:hypothetical protein
MQESDHLYQRISTPSVLQPTRIRKIISFKISPCQMNHKKAYYNEGSVQITKTTLHHAPFAIIVGQLTHGTMAISPTAAKNH